MANGASSQLQRLVLSASDLKEITKQKSGEPWTDALIEDYLNILRDAALLADEIDQNAGEIIAAQKRLFATVQSNRAQTSKNRARSIINKKELDSLAEDILNTFSFFPVKACSFLVDGNGVSNPVVQHSYNVSSIVRSGVGIYTVTLLQGTINGQSIQSRHTYTIEHLINPSASSDQYRVEVSSFVGSTLVLSVYAVTVGAGTRLEYTPYDLQVGDSVTFNILMNSGSGLLPPP
jgi:hypothetical protein